MTDVRFADGAEAISTAVNTIETILAAAQRSVEVIIKNETTSTLEQWAFVTGAVGEGGSGTWGSSPDPKIDPNSEEVFGIESDGAGAVGLAIYRIGPYKELSGGETTTLLWVYFACPLSTSDGVSCGLFSISRNYTSTERQTFANAVFETADDSKRSAQAGANFGGFGLNARYAGQNEGVATFTLTIA